MIWQNKFLRCYNTKWYKFNSSEDKVAIQYNYEKIVNVVFFFSLSIFYISLTRDNTYTHSSSYNLIVHSQLRGSLVKSLNIKSH
jgi:hypothetical protein